MASPENLLCHQASPYLLQHAANPVHWRPWGVEALAEARGRSEIRRVFPRVGRSRRGREALLPIRNHTRQSGFPARIFG